MCKVSYSKLRTFLARSGKKLVAAGIILALLIALFRLFTPHSVSHIRVRFLDEPAFNEPAFVYILYELNRLQKKWYFEVDFDVFNEAELTSAQRKELASGDKMTAAILLALDQPFIGITGEQIGEDYFWRNEGNVSVISTYGWKKLHRRASTSFWLTRLSSRASLFTSTLTLVVFRKTRLLNLA
jgi:hypothetical protein